MTPWISDVRCLQLCNKLKKKKGSTKYSVTNVSKPTSHSAVAKIKRKKAHARLMVSRPLYTDDAAKTAGTNRDKRGVINFPFTWLLSWC